MARFVTSAPILARLIEDKGMIALGPEEDASDVFTFVVALVYATNLNKVIPKDVCPPEEMEFCLEYGFFGEQIQTAPFRTLVEPDFEAHTVTARLLATPERVVQYVCNGGCDLTFKLCMAGVTLATATVDVGHCLRVTPQSLMAQRSVSYQGTVMMCAFDPARVDPVRPDRHSESHAGDPRVGFLLSLRHVAAYDTSVAGGTSSAGSSSLEAAEAEAASSSREWKRKLDGAVGDLDEWKTAQKKRFSEQLKQLEEQQNGALAAEWRRREEQREAVFRAKLEELCKLGDDLRGAFAKTREQMKQLALRENAIMAKEARLRERDAKHQLVSDQLTASNMARLEKEIRRLRAEAASAAASGAGRGVASLAADECNRLKIELQKTRLELDAARDKIKSNAAQERPAMPCDDELTREVICVKKENAALKANLASLQEDLDDVKSATSAKMSSMEREIQMLRARRQTAASPPPTAQQQQMSHHPMDLTIDDDNANNTTILTDNVSVLDHPAHVLTLQARRETLLRSGCYGPGDEVIRIIDATLSGLRGASGGHH